jgi:hypothetical protein
MRKINVCQEKRQLGMHSPTGKVTEPRAVCTIGKSRAGLANQSQLKLLFPNFVFSFGNYFYTQCTLTSYQNPYGL